MSKSLRTIYGNELAFANRHCLDHDRANDGVWTRLNVTRGLWKLFSERGRREEV